MISNGKTATRAAVLELQQEQVVVDEAYIFLDEKRLLLASELLRQLGEYQKLEHQLKELHLQAQQAVQSAVMSHGLNGLQVYPSASLEGVKLRQSSRNFMGVRLVDSRLDERSVEAGQLLAANPSGRIEHCRQLFSQITRLNALLAGISGNLYRLLAEYRITERRSRALENVILPEIKQSLREMSSHLEELDLEDAIRVHLHSGVQL